MLRFREALVASMVLYFSKNEFSFSLIRFGGGRQDAKSGGVQAFGMVRANNDGGKEQC
jgi:hypothetical protein